MKKIYDVSITLNDKIPIFPGNPYLEIKRTQTVEKDGCNVSEISMGCHTGTHIDAPQHFFNSGLPVSEIPIDILVGNAIVIPIENPKEITLEEVKSYNLNGNTRVLFKTRNSDFINLRQFHEDYVYLTPEAASYLVENDVKLVGIDYLSINKYGSDKQETHKILLSNKVVIIEGLDLSKIQPDEYELIALPIKLPTDGAPARVLLIK